MSLYLLCIVVTEANICFYSNVIRTLYNSLLSTKRLVNYTAAFMVALTVASCATFDNSAQAEMPAPPPIVMNIAPLPAEVSVPLAPPAPPLPPRTDCVVERCIALTFDDGPGGGTNQVLDNLRDRGAKATFFVLGSLAQGNPGVIRRMVAEGHQLANHSWGHRDLTGLGPAGAAEDINRTNSKLHEIAGVWPTVMRPPYGSTNDAIVASVNMPQMIWSVDPSDWLHESTSHAINYVVGNTTRGDIILLHDIHWSTVSAVPAILDGLLAQGYKFVTIDELYNHRPLEVRKHYSQYR